MPTMLEFEGGLNNLLILRLNKLGLGLGIMRYNAGMGVEIKSDKTAIWTKYDVPRHRGKNCPIGRIRREQKGQGFTRNPPQRKCRTRLLRHKSV